MSNLVYLEKEDSCSNTSSKNVNNSNYESRDVNLVCDNNGSLSTNENIILNNHIRLINSYGLVRRYAISFGYDNAIEFFNYLAKEHDFRFKHLARFLNKARNMRNNYVYNYTTYNIGQSFLDKLSLCVEICKEYDKLPDGKKLNLNLWRNV